MTARKWLEPKFVATVQRMYSSDDLGELLSCNDTWNLTVLFLARASQHSLFPEAGSKTPKRCDFIATAYLACRGIIDTRFYLDFEPALTRFDLREALVRVQLQKYESWSEELDSAARRDREDLPLSDRWCAILAAAETIYEDVNPRKVEHFARVIKDAMNRVGHEWSNAIDPRSEEDEMYSALFEARQSIFSNPTRDPGLFVRESDGQLTLGWRQMRDALLEARGQTRAGVIADQEFRRSVSAMDDDVDQLREAQAVVDLVDGIDQLEQVRAYQESRLLKLTQAATTSVEARQSNSLIVVNKLLELLSGELNLNELSITTGRAYSGLHKTLKREKSLLTNHLGHD
jgi:hypothetical protein